MLKLMTKIVPTAVSRTTLLRGVPASLSTSKRWLSLSPILCDKINYYNALGVDRSADTETIKTAYFRLAKRYHPDYNQSPGAAPMFELISEAFEVLSDPEKRKNYDEYGTIETFGGGTSRGPMRKRGDASFSSEELYKRFKSKQIVNRELLNDDQECFEGTIFGKSASKDVILTISFEDAAKGCDRVVPINQKIVCYKCMGDKSEMGFQGRSCPFCEGTGLETQKTGHVMTRRTCSYCEGTGVFIKFKCNECAGVGTLVLAVGHK